MKKLMMLSVSLSVMAISGLAHAADFQTITTTPAAPAAQAAPTTLAPAPAQAPAAKKPASLRDARIVPDTAPAPASATPVKKSDQGYSKMQAYNVVDDRNKPITNDWSRPKDWRIGYKNKNRTPVNE